MLFTRHFTNQICEHVFFRLYFWELQTKEKFEELKIVQFRYPYHGSGGILLNINQTNPGYFSMTEEAFLLCTLKEVVNIWSGGSGQASINFVVQDGVASLQLGRPDDPHILPQDQDSDHVQTEPQSQEHAGWQQQ